MLDLCDTAVIDRDQRAALGAGFPDVAPLKIAGEDDVRMLVKHFPVMDVAERPVIIAMPDKVSRNAGRIAGMAFAAIRRGVQHADIEVTGHGRLIARRQIVQHLPLLEALAVDGDLQTRNRDELPPCARKRPSRFPAAAACG